MELPGGVVMYGLSPEQEALLQKRGAFVLRYCVSKGWKVDELTIEQILEIRQHDGWINPK